MSTLLRLLLVLPFLVRGQNYKADMLSAMETTRSLKNYNMRTHYRFFIDGHAKPYQQISSLVKKNSQGHYYKQQGVEFMGNTRYDLYMDAETQTITVRKKSPGEPLMGADRIYNPTKDFDALLSRYDDIKVVSKTGHKITYRLHLKSDTMFEHILVSIDLDEKMLLKVQYNYKNLQRIAELKNTKHRSMLEISYEEIITGEAEDIDLFNEKKYLVFAGGEIKPALKYKGYTVNILN